MGRMSSKTIVAKADALALRLAKSDGWVMHPAIVPHERLDNPRVLRYWQMAAIAFEELKNTDIDAALSDLEDV